MSKKSVVVILLVIASLALMMAPVAAQEPVTITWFVGMGTGTSDQQIEAENQVVADFNAAHPEINLEINIAPSFETAVDTISTLIAAGTPPDIVGPVGVGGSNRYEWLDLKPLIDASGYDLSGFDPELLKLYETNNGGYSAIPFAIYPSVMYFSRDLFDEAGLNYPPQTFDTPYVMPDGTEVPWNYETVAEVAKILTVDANGADATMDDFDPENIVQFGLNFQWARIRLMWSDIQPESTYYDWETGQASLPDSWREATHWLWNGIWTDHFIPNRTYAVSDAFGAGSDNVFQTGKIAMAIVPLWYTCCIGDSVGNFEWDFAVVPQSLDGEYHVAMDADTFRITEGSLHPEEAFTVISYLLDEAVPLLAPTYGAFPARANYQQAWIDSQSERYDWGVNWQVAIDSIPYVNPAGAHHESNLPNWSQVYDREYALQTLMEGDTGATMDVDAELDTFIADVQQITEQQ
ncbi:MAG: extracellular solute-binding protein [Anaerolineae bacterium]|nr:extracellular solute-binding protein [Anaerolineae bacterium]